MPAKIYAQNLCELYEKYNFREFVTPTRWNFFTRTKNCETERSWGSWRRLWRTALFARY